MLGVVFTIAFLAYRDCSAAAGYFGCAYPLAGMFVLALVVFCYSLLLRSRFRISVTVIGIASIRIGRVQSSPTTPAALLVEPKRT